MYFISEIQHLYGEDERYYGSSFEIAPIVTEADSFNTVFIQEMWHRMRRDQKFKAQFHGNTAPYDAIILISASTAVDGSLYATAVLNNALPNRASCIHNARRTLRRMDKLVTDFMLDDNHDITLFSLARQFETAPSATRVELKNILKVYCRSKGMFINETDVSYATASAKERRRQAFNATHKC